jgi:hypothetical protein
MAIDIKEYEKLFNIDYAPDVWVNMQQKQSKLASHCKMDTTKADLKTYDNVESVEAVEMTSSFAEVVPTDLGNGRREVSTRLFSVAFEMNELDLERVKDGKEGQKQRLAAAAGFALNRKLDRVLYEAHLADVTVWNDKHGNSKSTLTYTQDGVRTIDATGGMTYEDLLAIKENQIDDEVMEAGGMYMTLTGVEHTDLMAETELTSGDYTRQFVIESGEIQKAMGIDFVKFGAKAKQPIIDVNASNERLNVVAVKGAVTCVVKTKPEVQISEIPGKIKTYLMKVFMEVNAIRREGKLIQLVKTSIT